MKIVTKKKPTKRNSYRINRALRTDRTKHDRYRVTAVEFSASEIRNKAKAILKFLQSGKPVRLFKGGYPLFGCSCQYAPGIDLTVTVQRS